MNGAVTVGRDPAELDALAEDFETAVAAALGRVAAVAADALGRHPALTAAGPSGPAGHPAGRGPGEPFASVDDLAVITTEWTAQVDGELLPQVGRLYTGAHVAFTADLADTVPDVVVPPVSNAAAEQYLAGARNRLAGAGQDLWETARSELLDGFAAGESIDNLAARVRQSAGLAEPRARVIARTEAISASNAGSIAAARLAGLDMRKKWLATRDVRTRISHADAHGQTVDLHAPFMVGGASLDFPGDPAGPAAEVINCRCSIIYEIPKPDAAGVAGVGPDLTGQGADLGGGENAQLTADVKAQVAADKLAAKPAGKLPPGADPKADMPAARRGGTAPDRATRDAARQRVDAAMRAAYTYDDPETGLRVKVKKVVYSDGENIVRADLEIRAARRGVVGESSRIWVLDGAGADGDLWVEHSYLSLDARVQGGGFAARFNAYAEGLYREAGVSRIGLQADIDVGGYAWAVHGYDFDDFASLERIARRFVRYTPLYDQAVREEIAALVERSTPADFAAGTAPTPYEWAMVGRGQAAGEEGSDGTTRMMWAGKRILLGSDWMGRKPLQAALTAAAPGPAARPQVLAYATADALAYANVVAARIPAVPGDATPRAGDGASDYAEHHHLISAAPPFDQALLELADTTLADTTLGGAGMLTAAAQVHTGAMVALVPSQEDLARLTVDGGEPADQLHCTLMYLGEAADIPAETQTAIVDALRGAVDDALTPDYDLPLQADGFALSLFNPSNDDRDTCIVLGLSGQDLAGAHAVAVDAVTGAATAAGVMLPDQHAPWQPHITLIYTDDAGQVADLVDRAGPITFDVLRVAFAGEHTDIPLNPPPSTSAGPIGSPPAAVSPGAAAGGAHGGNAMTITQQPDQLAGQPANPAQPQPGAQPADGQCPEGQTPGPDGTCVPDDRQPAGQASQVTAEHFHSIMHVEGVSTGMRTFVEGALTWRQPPFAFRWQTMEPEAGGHALAVHIGNVSRVERDGAALHGWGPLDLGSQAGLDYARRLVEGFERWVSIGLDESLKEADVEYVWPETDNPDDGDGDGGGLLDMLFAEPEQIIFHAGRIAELTAVSVPAQAEAVIEPTQALIDILTQMGVIGEQTAQVASAALAAGSWKAIGAHSTSTSDSSWDGPGNEKRLPAPMPVATARKAYAWVDDAEVTDGEVTKGGCRFIHHEISADGTPGAANTAACSTGIGILHGGRGGTTIPDADRRGVYDHLAKHMRDAGLDPPPFACETLTAAGHTITIPDPPPGWWFDEPVDEPAHGALTVTDGGRVYGYLAPAEVAHRSFRDRRVTVPMGRVDYSRWMGGEAIVAGGGRVVAGPITMNCGHADPGSRDLDGRRQHYDNTCSVVAQARIGENRHGVWIAGALLPGVTGDQIARMLACRLSGDWQPLRERPGWQEFVAALLVPVPGFPMARSSPSVRMSDGALVASAVPVRFEPHTGPADLAGATSGAGVDLRPVVARLARSIGRDPATRVAELRARIHTTTPTPTSSSCATSSAASGTSTDGRG